MVYGAAGRFNRSSRGAAAAFAATLCIATAHAQLDRHALATRYFGNDAPWFERNIPFFEIDDAAIQDTYYYRWKLYRSHLREIGPEGLTVTEFLADVPWARHPYTDLNDSSAFHIREGRWLRDPAIVASLVDHLYAGGGNDRHFSEWNAAATLDYVRVTGNAAPALRNLAAMRRIYEEWNDHFDFRRGLYWIEPLHDATEYTIGSIDSSGAGFSDAPSKDQSQNGFTGGFAFRPSINSYQYANALAIANFAERSGQTALAKSFRDRAKRLRAATLTELWNPKLQHFTDIFQRSTSTVRAGDFIRGRELVGYTPWMFGVVPTKNVSHNLRYNTAWKHVQNPAELAGPHGLRTVEPAYPRYLTQYRYDAATGKPECQWNGPSWPFQTSQTLTGLANFIQDEMDYSVKPEEYLALLQQYTGQHRLPNGTLDLQEDSNPDSGAPIVGLARSHHYNHSTYNDLLFTGLIGIEPRDDDTLQITPLLPSEQSPLRFKYFLVQGLRYHGRDLTIRWDEKNEHYREGIGLTVECDGKRILGPWLPDISFDGGVRVKLCPLLRTAPVPPLPNDVAVNVFEHEPKNNERAPRIVASSTAPGSDPYQAIDGRLWFFPEIPNGWSPGPVDSKPSLTLTLPGAVAVHQARFAFFEDDKQIAAPAEVALSVQEGSVWRRVAATRQTLRNGITEFALPTPLRGTAFRLDFQLAPGKSMRLIEAEFLTPGRAPSDARLRDLPHELAPKQDRKVVMP